MSGILKYYSNVSQEGEDLFLSTLTVSGCVQNMEYLLTFTFCMCCVWNTEILLEHEPGGEGLFLSTLTVSLVCRVWNIC